MATIVFVLAAISALVALFCGITFWIRCLEVERSWATPIPASGEGHDRGIKAAISRERKRTRIAIPVLVAYIATLLLGMWLKDGFGFGNAAFLPLTIVASIGLLIVSLRAMVHNDRCFEQRMKNRWGN